MQQNWMLFKSVNQWKKLLLIFHVFGAPGSNPFVICLPLCFYFANLLCFVWYWCHPVSPLTCLLQATHFTLSAALVFQLLGNIVVDHSNNMKKWMYVWIYLYLEASCLKRFLLILDILYFGHVHFGQHLKCFLADENKNDALLPLCNNDHFC